MTPPLFRRLLRPASTLVLGLGLSLSVAPHLQAQTASETRSPATGLAVVDCKPAAPAPSDSCTLRIPPLHSRGDMRGSGSGFSFIGASDSRFPRAVHPSATMLLVDRTPGPGGSRKPFLAFEKDLVARLIGSLPPQELVAVYTFDESGTLQPLAPFTEVRQRAIDAVDGLKSGGVNTHIALNLLDAIKILAERQDVLFRNIIVVTDGEEEGLFDDHVHERAIDARIAVSSLGFFWRGSGSAEIGRAKDYLDTRITTPGFGLTGTVMLRNRTAAVAAVDDFATRYGGALFQSGLIVPEGKPEAADVVVETEAPKIGAPGGTETVTHRVRFAPQEAAAAAEPAPAKEPDALILGYPRLWVLGGAGGLVLVLLLLAGLIVFLRRGGPGEEDELPLGDDDDLDLGASARAAAPLHAAAPVRAMATLVREDTRERLAVPSPMATIGRAATNAVAISDDSISRLHAELKQTGGGLLLSDMGSLNGTFVNGRRIKEGTKVKNGDQIGFGQIKLRLVAL
ncbi:FHA domain-containing protein [Rhodobacter sp. CZR27]|uniref:FHA domain-containing protein n=1 Tax=Rhodobacter sp. CZR27 TaxID=2033869 RepID=UPI001E420B29|nr:FHA domain-containing protein [Rhodobacter sp. CZR27]